MKTCQIWGDLSSDSAAEQYPTVPVCEDCVATESVGPDAAIISVGAYDSSLGDECEFCGKTKKEEEEGM